MREDLKIVIEYFQKKHYDYALIGALALHVYGYTRATKDIDFITRFEYQANLIQYLESFGYETIHRSAGYSNHLHSMGLVRIDFVYVEAETAATIFRSVENRSIFEDIVIPVVSAEHLILLKLFALKNDPDRKYRELADIGEILMRLKVDERIINRSEFEKRGLGYFYDDIMSRKRVEKADE